MNPLFAYTPSDLIQRPAFDMVYTRMIPNFYLLSRVLPLTAHLTSPWGEGGGLSRQRPAPLRGFLSHSPGALSKPLGVILGSSPALRSHTWSLSKPRWLLLLNRCPHFSPLHWPKEIKRHPPTPLRWLLQQPPPTGPSLLCPGLFGLNTAARGSFPCPRSSAPLPALPTSLLGGGEAGRDKQLHNPRLLCMEGCTAAGVPGAMGSVVPRSLQRQPR